MKIPACIAVAALNMILLPLALTAGPMESTYPVTVKVECSSPQEAEKADLKILPLPPGKNVAFSCRWDDTNPRHPLMKRLMTKYGYKGTFYLAGLSRKNYKEEVLPELLKDGCSIGNHTLHHLYLPLFTPNGIHYEILGARILHESVSDRPENAFVFPFGKISWPFLPDSEQIISTCLRRAGILGGPDLATHRLDQLPGNEFYSPEGKMILPGDRNTKTEKFDSDVKRHLPPPGETAHLVLGIHVWHSDEDLRRLGESLKKYADRPDWWYCNENEFLAYARMRCHARIEGKKVEGNDAVFTIALPFPEDLGCSIPLWAECAGKVFPVEHTRKIPQSIDAVEGPGNSVKFPGLQAQLSLEKPNRIRLSIVNSGEALEDARITLRLPPVFRQETIVLQEPKIEGNYTKEWALELDPSVSPAGKQLTASQIDFTRNGTRGRLWVSCLQKNPHPADEILSVRCSTKKFTETEMEALSRPGPIPADFVPMEHPDDFRSCACQVPQKLRNKNSLTVIVEFTGRGKMILKGSLPDTFYCNGEKITTKGGVAELPAAAGPRKAVMKLGPSKSKYPIRYFVLIASPAD